MEFAEIVRVKLEKIAQDRLLVECRGDESYLRSSALLESSIAQPVLVRIKACDNKRAVLYRTSAFWLAVFVAIPAFAQDPKTPGVPNFHAVNEHLYRGGQPA